MSCAFEDCLSHTGKKGNLDEALSFHRFPKDEEMRNQWIAIVNRPSWTWKIHSRVCSKHFSPDSFQNYTDIKWRRVKATALPTLHLPDTNTWENDPLSLEGLVTTADSRLPKPWHKPEKILGRGAAVPMDVCDAKRRRGPSQGLAETSINIDVPKQQTMVPSTSMIEVISDTDTQSTVESRLHMIKMEPGFKYESAKSWLASDTAINVCTSCNHYKKTILRLQRQLERVQKVSQRRRKKIITLTQRLSRQIKRTDDLKDIMNRLNEENIETEYLTISDNIT